jgi:hypothetical protein
MKRTYKFILAALFTVGLVLVSTAVWAQTAGGSLGPNVKEKSISGAISPTNNTINMRDAIFTVVGYQAGATIHVSRVGANSELGTRGIPSGKARWGSIFRITSTGVTAVQVCFPYTPKAAKKNVSIFVQTGDTWAPVRVTINGTPLRICATVSGNTTVGLFGNP